MGSKADSDEAPARLIEVGVAPGRHDERHAVLRNRLGAHLNPGIARMVHIELGQSHRDVRRGGKRRIEFDLGFLLAGDRAGVGGRA